MENQHLTTFKVSLVASVIGTLAWYLGIGEAVWPAHPHVAALLITILSYYIVSYYWKSALSGTAANGSK